MIAWMFGSIAGFWIGVREGPWLLERPGLLGKTRSKLLAKGAEAFGRHNFSASVSDLNPTSLRTLAPQPSQAASHVPLLPFVP